jgi:hypothetical protein
MRTLPTQTKTVKVFSSGCHSIRNNVVVVHVALSAALVRTRRRGPVLQSHAELFDPGPMGIGLEGKRFRRHEALDVAEEHLLLVITVGISNEVGDWLEKLAVQDRLQPTLCSVDLLDDVLAEMEMSRRTHSFRLVLDDVERRVVCKILCYLGKGRCIVETVARKEQLLTRYLAEILVLCIDPAGKPCLRDIRFGVKSILMGRNEHLPDHDDGDIIVNHVGRCPFPSRWILQKTL